MPLHTDSVPKTAFTLPGLEQYEWLTSPMGLLRCPASFQRLMEKLMNGIENVIVYKDDLLIHSKTHDHHLLVLDIVMTRLSENNMKINIAKCFFGNTEVNYLGFRKEKPIKTNNSSVNEINDKETEIDAVNNRGNFQNNYRGNNSKGRGGYSNAQGSYRGPPNNNNKGTPPTTQSRGAYKGNSGNQSQGNRGGQTQNNDGNNDKDNCKYCHKPGHSVEKCWKLQAKKASMNMNNEDEYNDDHEQTQESETPISTVYNAHSN